MLLNSMSIRRHVVTYAVTCSKLVDFNKAKGCQRPILIMITKQIIIIRVRRLSILEGIADESIRKCFKIALHTNFRLNTRLRVTYNKL